ncbi:MAG: 30S ribosomal protein S6e [Sulfolobales archaeon]
MPEIKVVISDPDVKEKKWLKVILVGDPSLPYGDEEKSGKKLMRAKIPKIVQDIVKPELGVLNARVWRSSNEKVNFTLQISAVEDIDSLEIKIPATFMKEKFGAERVVGEISRAKSYQITLPSDRAQRLYGYKIGDVIEGGLVGLPGYNLMITGGSDYAGAPMLPTLPGPGKRYILLNQPPGFRPKEKGLRKRKFVRGNTIGEATVQANTVIIRKTETKRK